MPYQVDTRVARVAGHPIDGGWEVMGYDIIEGTPGTPQWRYGVPITSVRQ